MRVLSETADWPPSKSKLALAGLRDPDAYVQRAAADALGCHPQDDQIRALLDARHGVSAEDVQLLHTVRMALRNQLQAPGSFQKLSSLSLSEADSRALADVSLGVKSPEAGSFVLRHIEQITEPRENLLNYLRHAGRYAPDAELDRVGELVRAKFPSDPDAQFTAYKSVQDGFTQRGGGMSAGLRAWAARIAQQLLAPIDEPTVPWISLPLNDADTLDNPWTIERRRSADGNRDSPFLSSLPVNEKLTGILHSRPFTIPAQL